MQTSSLAVLNAALMPDPGPPTTIVDRLIAERAPGLSSTATGRFLLRRLLHRLLDYPTAVDLVERIAALGGHEIFALIRDTLQQRIVASGLEHIPPTGRVIIAANHPTGLADGIAVHEAVSRVRRDVWFLANSDALRVAPGLSDLIVPVEWVEEKRSHARTKELLQGTARVLAQDHALVVFPSGRLSYLSWRGVVERPWQPTVLGLARKFRAPILPLRLIARNSALFYAFSQVSRELRDITLFHELLNKRGRMVELQAAPLVRITDFDSDPAVAIKALQRHVERGFRRPLGPPSQSGSAPLARTHRDGGHRDVGAAEAHGHRQG